MSFSEYHGDEKTGRLTESCLVFIVVIDFAAISNTCMLPESVVHATCVPLALSASYVSDQRARGLMHKAIYVLY